LATVIELKKTLQIVAARALRATITPTGKAATPANSQKFRR
jgi:hypothetical protein